MVKYLAQPEDAIGRMEWHRAYIKYMIYKLEDEACNVTVCMASVQGAEVLEYPPEGNITIEAESIRDSGDKMLIASYCLSKLEIVEWYIELLDVGSKKYIVPHTRPYLEMMRTELLKCYDKILKVKIIPPSERPIIDIKYPKVCLPFICLFVNSSAQSGGFFILVT